MNSDFRQNVVHNRAAVYTATMAITLIGFAVIGLALHLGDGAYSAPFMTLTLTLTAFGILAGNSALDDLDNLVQDMPDELKETAYGKGVLARDFKKLKKVSTILIGITGLATFLTLLL